MRELTDSVKRLVPSWKHQRTIPPFPKIVKSSIISEKSCLTWLHIGKVGLITTDENTRKKVDGAIEKKAKNNKFGQYCSRGSSFLRAKRRVTTEKSVPLELDGRLHLFTSVLLHHINVYGKEDMALFGQSLIKHDPINKI